MRIVVETINWKTILDEGKYRLSEPNITTTIDRDDFNTNEEAWNFFCNFFDIDELISFEETDDYIALFNGDKDSEIKIKMFKPIYV